MHHFMVCTVHGGGLGNVSASPLHDSWFNLDLELMHVWGYLHWFIPPHLPKGYPKVDYLTWVCVRSGPSIKMNEHLNEHKWINVSLDGSNTVKMTSFSDFSRNIKPSQLNILTNQAHYSFSAVLLNKIFLVTGVNVLC